MAMVALAWRIVLVLLVGRPLDGVYTAISPWLHSFKAVLRSKTAQQTFACTLYAWHIFVILPIRLLMPNAIARAHCGIAEPNLSSAAGPSSVWSVSNQQGSLQSWKMGIIDWRTSATTLHPHAWRI